MANIASALPITPGALGVVEVTLVAVTVGFGTPRPTAVLAVVGYRIVLTTGCHCSPGPLPTFASG